MQVADDLLVFEWGADHLLGVAVDHGELTVEPDGCGLGAVVVYDVDGLDREGIGTILGEAPDDGVQADQGFGFASCCDLD